MWRLLTFATLRFRKNLGIRSKMSCGKTVYFVHSFTTGSQCKLPVRTGWLYVILILTKCTWTAIMEGGCTAMGVMSLGGVLVN
jgi:hypothetical protein